MNDEENARLEEREQLERQIILKHAEGLGVQAWLALIGLVGDDYSATFDDAVRAFEHGFKVVLPDVDDAGALRRFDDQPTKWKLMIEESQREGQCATREQTLSAMRETPWLVHCHRHGACFLTEEQYDHQMRHADDVWRCPICNEEAEWDDEHYDNHPSNQEPEQDDDHGI